jgi:hypothetical protein
MDDDRNRLSKMGPSSAVEKMNEITPDIGGRAQDPFGI